MVTLYTNCILNSMNVNVKQILISIKKKALTPFLSYPPVKVLAEKKKSCEAHENT